jgi:serine/threonine protein kinase
MTTMHSNAFSRRSDVHEASRSAALCPGTDDAIDAHFELLARAGRGGMGEVYRARERASGRIVALKLLPADGGDARRFVREARLLQSVDHPAVVKHLGHGVRGDGAHYLVMEWLQGQDLDKRLAEGPLTVAQTVALAQGVAAALAATHRKGIVHRDLKPANVMLPEGRIEAATLVDFGLACSVGDVRLTAPGTALGTLGYMPPEQLRGDLIDARVDVYALGSLLFECLTGRAPFEGENQVAVCIQVLRETAPSVRTLRPDAPVELAALIARMLERERDLRPADGAAVVAALRSPRGWRASGCWSGLGRLFRRLRRNTLSEPGHTATVPGGWS